MTAAPVLILLAHRINWRPVMFGSLIVGVVAIWAFAVIGVIAVLGVFR